MQEITPLQASHLLSNDQAILIDVREDHEYVAEHIEGAHHLALSQFEEAFANFECPTDKSLIVMCLKGGRSRQACFYLDMLASCQAELFNMDGGITAWKEQKLPTISNK